MLAGWHSNLDAFATRYDAAVPAPDRVVWTLDTKPTWAISQPANKLGSMCRVASTDTSLDAARHIGTGIPQSLPAFGTEFNIKQTHKKTDGCAS